MTLAFNVIGVPAPKGSVVKFRQGGYAHGRNAEERERIKSWATAVAEVASGALPAGWQPIAGPVSVSVEFRMQPTKDRYRTRHATTPDLDKLARNTLDALVAAGVMANDSLIHELHLRKRYVYSGWVGAVITVVDDTVLEAADREAAKKAAALTRKPRVGAGR